MAREKRSPSEPTPTDILPDETTLEMAQSIHDYITARLQDETQPDDNLDAVFTEAFVRVSEPLIAERLSELSPVEFAALYAQIVGNDELAHHLQHSFDLRKMELANENYRRSIDMDVKTWGFLDVGKLAVDETIQIGLFDAKRPRLASRQFVDDPSARSHMRTIMLRIIEPHSGGAEVLRDTWFGPIWANNEKPELLPSHTYTQLGTMRSTEQEATARHIYKTAPLSMTIESTTQTTEHIVGFIETMDGTLILDGRL